MLLRDGIRTPSARKAGKYFTSNRCNNMLTQESVHGGKIPVDAKKNPRSNKTFPQRMTDCQNQVGHSYVNNNLIVEKIDISSKTLTKESG
jgi:hypothetical protein